MSGALGPHTSPCRFCQIDRIFAKEVGYRGFVLASRLDQVTQTGYLRQATSALVTGVFEPLFLKDTPPSLSVTGFTSVL